MPQSPFEIPWINLLFLTSHQARQRINEKWWGVCRLTGYTLPKENDVLVFKSPQFNKVVLVKRCVALPGDTFMVKNDSVYVNSIASNDIGEIYNRVIFSSRNNFV